MDYQTMMDQMATNNPQIKMMLDMMAAQKNATAEVDPETEALEQAKAEIGQLIGSVERQQKQISSLQQKCGSLEQGIKVLLERNDRMAYALGACAECWGEEECCPACRGEGRSGHFRARPELFDRFVRPAVEANRSAATAVVAAQN